MLPTGDYCFLFVTGLEPEFSLDALRWRCYVFAVSAVVIAMTGTILIGGAM